MAASATFALKAGVWFRRGRLFIVSPDSLAQRARCQAETPLIVLFRFLRPAPIVFGEMDLRRLLRFYARYYNEIRTHRSLDKDAPVTRPVQRVGVIISRAVLGGLHHHYARV